MKHLFNHMHKAVFIIALVMITASCTFKTLYNQLDNLIPYYVEGMVTLDSMLEEKVMQRSLVLINWHRNTQLNQYANWLRVLQGDINGKLTYEKIQKHIVSLERFWHSISLKVDDEMVLLLPMLNKEQRDELFSNLDEKNEEFREEYTEVKGEERITQYNDRLVDSYETWLGELTDKQEVLVRQSAAKLHSTASYRLERRQQWQQSIKRILDANNRSSQKKVSLRHFFMNYKSQGNGEINKIVNFNKKIVSGLTLQIVHSMTDKQKAHLDISMNDYIRMFEELATEH